MEKFNLEKRWKLGRLIYDIPYMFSFYIYHQKYIAFLLHTFMNQTESATYEYFSKQNRMYTFLYTFNKLQVIVCKYLLTIR